MDRYCLMTRGPGVGFRADTLTINPAVGARAPHKSRFAGGVALPETADVNQSVVKVDPEIMSGAPCFIGTRVPIQNLIDYLEGGDSIDEFLEDFPSVSRESRRAFESRK